MSDTAIVFATFLGPIFAVWASEWRYNRRKAQEKRENIFQTLMSTRAIKLNISHIEALNQIDFAFLEKPYTAVRESWNLYRKHLQLPEAHSHGDSQNVWQGKSKDLFDDLLHQMALSLKLSFPKSYISDNSYHPSAYLYAELDNLEIRQLLLQVLKNQRAINIKPVSDDPTQPFAKPDRCLMHQSLHPAVSPAGYLSRYTSVFFPYKIVFKFDILSSRL